MSYLQTSRGRRKGQRDVTFPTTDSIFICNYIYCFPFVKLIHVITENLENTEYAESTKKEKN